MIKSFLFCFLSFIEPNQLKPTHTYILRRRLGGCGSVGCLPFLLSRRLLSSCSLFCLDRVPVVSCFDRVPSYSGRSQSSRISVHVPVGSCPVLCTSSPALFCLHLILSCLVSIDCCPVSSPVLSCPVLSVCFSVLSHHSSLESVLLTVNIRDDPRCIRSHKGSHSEGIVPTNSSEQ